MSKTVFRIKKSKPKNLPAGTGRIVEAKVDEKGTLRVDVELGSTPSTIQELDFKTDKSKLNHAVKSLKEIHSWAWGPVGHAVGVLLRELGETLKHHPNGGRKKP